MELVIRFDYGSVIPWVRSVPGGISAIGGPDSLVLRTPVPLRGENLHTIADFVVAEGERVPFNLTWFHPIRNLLESSIRRTRWKRRFTRREPVDNPLDGAIQRLNGASSGGGNPSTPWTILFLPVQAARLT